MASTVKWCEGTVEIVDCDGVWVQPRDNSKLERAIRGFCAALEILLLALVRSNRG